MRSLLAACALLMLGTAVADAQPYFGYGRPHYGYGYGYGFHRAPVYGYGYRRPFRRCFFVRGYYGPRRVCRGVY